MATSWVSKISSPIPHHKIYENTEFTTAYPVGKSGSKIRGNSDGFSVKGKSCLGNSKQKEVVSPKDHIQENVKRIRELQRASRARQEENRQNRGPLKSTSRPNSSCLKLYNDNDDDTTDESSIPYAQSKRVKSAGVSPLRLNIGCQSSPPQCPVSYYDKAASARPASTSYPYRSHSAMTRDAATSIEPNPKTSYLKAHEKTGPPLELNTYPISPIPKHPRQEKLTVPKASTAREVQLIRREVDFVKANAYAAKSARMKRSPSADSLLHLQSKHQQQSEDYRKGELPSYLIKRRQLWQQEQDTFIANQPDPDQPPGHRKMSEKERKATLVLLKSTEKDLLSELGKMPIRSDTLRLKTRKQEIEQKLNMIEEAIKIFSKPKVFIKIEDEQNYNQQQRLSSYS